MYNSVISRVTVGAIPIAFAVAMLSLPRGLALIIVGVSLLGAAVVFLLKGDIVLIDLELSFYIKNTYCTFLFGSACAIIYLGVRQPISRSTAPSETVRDVQLARSDVIAATTPGPPTINIAGQKQGVTEHSSETTLPINESQPTSPRKRVSGEVDNFTVSGAVFARIDGTNKPLASAGIRAGQNEAFTDSRGRFTLRFSTKPRSDLLLKINHGDCLPRFRRLDEVQSEAETILEPKLRITVLNFSVPVGADLVPTQRAVRNGIEKELTQTGHIKVVISDNERSTILHLLNRQHQERGVYDKEMLIQFGKMQAALYGIFGSITSEGPYYRITCTLVNYSTGITENEQVIRVRDGPGWGDFAGSVVADQILAQLSKIRILTPIENSSNERVIKAEGFAVLRPPDWSLWLTLVPSGMSLHFPQQRLTVESDESWKSSDVHLGTESSTLQPQAFTLYALLTDPEYSQVISNYLKSKTNVGLDINAWDKSRYRIGHSIELLRSDKPTAN